MRRAKITTLLYSLATLLALLCTLGKGVQALGRLLRRHGGLLGRHGGLLYRHRGINHFPHLVELSLVQLELGDKVGDKLLDFGVHLFWFSLYSMNIVLYFWMGGHHPKFIFKFFTTLVGFRKFL